MAFTANEVLVFLLCKISVFFFTIFIEFFLFLSLVIFQPPEGEEYIEIIASAVEKKIIECMYQFFILFSFKKLNK